MAEGWARALLAPQFESYSAGTEPQGINPYAVRAMLESGIDISAHRSKSLADFTAVHFDLLVTVCDHAASHCPRPPSESVIMHMPFDDPPKLALGAETDEEIMPHYRRVRDEIRSFVEELPRAWEKAARQK